MDIWISDSQFSSAPTSGNTLIYRTYIYNYQEDIWRYLYSKRDFQNCKICAYGVSILLKYNYDEFINYLNSPSQEKIDAHIINVGFFLNYMRTNILHYKEIAGDEFTGNLFLTSIEKMVNEYTVGT